jgi:hypothetical protein
MTDARRRPFRLLLSVVATAAGLALLAWQIADAGPALILEHLSNVGLPGFLAILVISGARLLMRALAWRSLIPDAPPLRRALAATISGDAVGNLTLLSLLASEPTKAMYLGGRADASRVFAALAAENYFYSLSVAVYVTLGTGAMLVSFANLPAQIRIAGLVTLVAMAAVLLAGIWLAWRQPRMLAMLVSRLPGRRAQAFAARLQTFEASVYGATAHPEARIGRLLACECTFHVLSFVEAWLTLWLLTGGSYMIESFVLDTVSRVVKIVFRVVPMQVGVDEATAEPVARAIDLADGIGVATALVRKARVAFWSLIGIVLLTRKGLSTRTPT